MYAYPLNFVKYAKNADGQCPLPPLWTSVQAEDYRGLDLKLLLTRCLFYDWRKNTPLSRVPFRWSRLMGYYRILQTRETPPAYRRRELLTYNV